MATTKNSPIEIDAPISSNNGITEDDTTVILPTTKPKVKAGGPPFKFDLLKLLAKTKAQARPYQQRIVTKVVRAMTTPERGGKGLRSALINSPTGSGKTVMALLIGKALQVREGCLIAWISMRRNLLEQAGDENAAPSEVNPKGKAICAKIHFISMFEKNLPPELLPENREGKKLLIIVDEAQHDAANSCAHIHAQLKGDYILGMTATPFRTDRVKLCFDTVINDAGIGALIREGYLSQYEHYTIPKWGVREAVKCYLRDKEKWGKSIFYFHTIAQCQQATDALRARGVNVEMVTGDSDRTAQLARFAKGESQVIVNCMVLTEGFDCPDLQTVFLRPSCKGVTIQMAGRAFRIHPSVPVKNIVQCEKTKWPFVKTAEPVYAYKWQLPSGVKGTPSYKEGVWLSLTPNKHINEMNCKMLVALASIDMKLPEFMTKAKFSKRGRKAKKRL